MSNPGPLCPDSGPPLCGMETLPSYGPASASLARKPITCLTQVSWQGGVGSRQRGRGAGQDEAFPVTGAAAAGRARQGAGPGRSPVSLRVRPITFPSQIPPICLPAKWVLECARKGLLRGGGSEGLCMGEDAHVMCWCKPPGVDGSRVTMYGVMVMST